MAVILVVLATLIPVFVVALVCDGAIALIVAVLANEFVTVDAVPLIPAHLTILDKNAVSL